MTYVRGFWSENWGKQQQNREYLSDWDANHTTNWLGTAVSTTNGWLAVSAQLVFRVQMPLKLIPEAAARRSDLFESARKLLGLASFTQSLFQPEVDRAHGFTLQFLCTNSAILCPGILDCGWLINLAFYANFHALAVSCFVTFLSPKGNKICQLLLGHHQHGGLFTLLAFVSQSCWWMLPDWFCPADSRS